MEYSYFQCILREDFNSALLTASYAPLNITNSNGFSHDIKILKIYNGSNVDFDISYDGVNPHDYFPAGATIIIDLQTNHECNSSYGSGEKRGRKGQIIYGKGAAGVGILRIIGFY